MEARKTLFVDIDGTLLKHHEDGAKGLYMPPEVLPGVIEKTSEWDKKEYFVILTTGRKESLREMTVDQLRECNISYDLLIMGIGHGERIVINDYNSKGEARTRAIDVERNKGLEHLRI